MEELTVLLRPGQDYDDRAGKRALLGQYLERCRHTLSGRTVRVPLTDLADDLEKRADWLTGHLRRQEWIDGGEEGWFNSYYDNDGWKGSSPPVCG